MSELVLPSVYLGPLEWYAMLLQHPVISIEQHEHYIKQTWRNRCRIVGANSTQDLVIPVHLKGNHTSMQEVLIDYDGNWQRRHWQSIRSAYGNSPFFDFYAEHFAPFFEKQSNERLIDFNTALLQTTLRLLKVKSEIKFTETFEAYKENDPRLDISPKSKTPNTKLPTPNSELPTYLQVFQDRHGFLPNLSIIDLLCCCGPGSINVLQGQ